jgi:hypothetical protein
MASSSGDGIWTSLEITPSTSCFWFRVRPRRFRSTSAASKMSTICISNRDAKDCSAESGDTRSRSVHMAMFASTSARRCLNASRRDTSGRMTGSVGSDFRGLARAVSRCRLTHCRTVPSFCPYSSAIVAADSPAMMRAMSDARTDGVILARESLRYMALHGVTRTL